MSPSQSPDEGVLYVVGTGPGASDMLTVRARECIARSTHVLGHKLYLDVIADLLEGKEIVTSGMGREVDRAIKALELAREHSVAMVSGGDPGVFGMASIVLEVAESRFPDVKVEIVPGLTAASAAASLLGAPLSIDFMVVSLSDLLTPWEAIEKRLRAGFSLGIPVVLYNPKSHRRTGLLHQAMGIALESLPPSTPAGVVRNAYRPGSSVAVTTVGALERDDSMVDMHTVLVIGGLTTRNMIRDGAIAGMLTPRGYDRKYDY